VSSSTPSVLARILQSTRAEVKERKLEVSHAELEARLAMPSASAPATGTAAAGEAPRGFRAALTQPGIAVIAEFKRCSPSAGAMREGADLAAIIDAYEHGGASALSVLTEGPNFGGSLEDLRAARASSGLPLLRKDFVVDEYQLLEARAAGADAVLLIVAALADEELAALDEAARALGLDVLVEVHDRDELERALVLGASSIGINNRDLRDFSVDVGRTKLLRNAIPDGIAVVSESGISSSEQLRSLEQDGVDAVLVGESLMRSPDPARALGSLLGRGQLSASETARLPSAG
jgi:indole-3-glycerol phosphate synthase